MLDDSLEYDVAFEIFSSWRDARLTNVDAALALQKHKVW